MAAPDGPDRAADDSADSEVEVEALTPTLVLPEQDALRLLAHGELSVEGRLVDASNATLYCAISLDGVTAACVYKPEAGERPLWDFPDGTLAGREVAAYTVSAATGWDLVPPTVLREDGPFGGGMAQLWIDTDEAVDMRRVSREWADPLRKLAVFDAVVNNADRKGGHLLPVSGPHLYAVDHGVTFHIEDKLRTILWHWAGDPLDAEHEAVLLDLRAALDADLGTTLRTLITGAEVRAVRRRIDRLLATGCFPEPSGEWPATPWPPW